MSDCHKSHSELLPQWQRNWKQLTQLLQQLSERTDVLRRPVWPWHTGKVSPQNRTIRGRTTSTHGDTYHDLLLQYTLQRIWCKQICLDVSVPAWHQVLDSWNLITSMIFNSILLPGLKNWNVSHLKGLFGRVKELLRNSKNAGKRWRKELEVSATELWPGLWGMCTQKLKSTLYSPCSICPRDFLVIFIVKIPPCSIHAQSVFVLISDR